MIPLLHDPHRLAAMGRAAAAYGRRDGDEALLDFVYEAAPGSASSMSTWKVTTLNIG